MNSKAIQYRILSMTLTIIVMAMVVIPANFGAYAHEAGTQKQASTVFSTQTSTGLSTQFSTQTSTGLSTQFASHSNTSENAVTVYVTISDDGKLLIGKDTNKTIMARVPITVEYFDLKDYGLEEYYRYETASFTDGGGYINTNLIKRPTILHCYIKILEKYYLNGNKLNVGSDAFNIEGAPTSTYITKFWGHDSNLMYFADHAYPMMKTGVGATSDYLLLENGMEIDIAMFTDYGFYTDGAFAYFDPVEKTANMSDPVNLTMLGTTTNATWNGESSGVNQPMKNEKVLVSDDNGKTWTDSGKLTDTDGKVSLTFTKPGTYYISSGPLYNTYKMANGSPCVAPPVSVITVNDNSVKPTEPGIKPTEPAIQPTKPGITKPNAPTEMKALAKTYDTISISWNKVNSVDGYQIFRAQSKNGDYERIGSTAKTNFNNPGLKTGKTYFYKIKAYKSEDGEVVYSDFSAGVSGKTALLAPTKLKAKAGKKSATISWKKSQGASGYEIYRSSKNGKYKKVKTIKSGKTQKFKNKKLKKKSKYRYKIRAYRIVDGKAVYSKFSKATTVKTKKL